MARPLRVHIPGVLYHVMSRGNARQQIFLDADDYARFLARLTVTAARFGVRCRAYCLMVTHFHLLLEPNLFPLSRMMQQLNSSYSQSFNRRHERVGHLLQGRFKSPMIDGDDYFRRVLRYIALNPVRGGLVAHPAEWPWSSYRATAGLETRPSLLTLDRVWRSFDADPSVAQRRYVAFVAGGPPGHTDRLPGPMADGREPFLSHLGKILEAHRDEADVTYAERFACRPSLDRIFEYADDAAALDQSMREAFEHHGYTLREIGDFVRRPANTVWRRIRRVSGQADRGCLWKT
jgi:REP element-mobilizing transposase RayT